MDHTLQRPAVQSVDVAGFDGYVLSGAGALTATFLPGLGMVGCSLRHDGEELLTQLGGPDAYAACGSTFALPLLHPWANRLSDWTYSADGQTVHLDAHSPGIHIDSRSGLPIHGLLAGFRGWKVVAAGPDGDAAALHARLDFDAHTGLLAGFPFPHRLDLRASVRDSSLTVDVELTATGDVAVPVAFGFHPYLTLPGSDRSEWELVFPVRRRMQLDECGLPSGPSAEVDGAELSGPLGARTFDDCFDELDADPVFVMSDARRRIAVSFGEGYTVAQVFAPSAKQFVCFEPMAAPVDALVTGDGLRSVAPGRSFSARFAIDVASI